MQTLCAHNDEEIKIGTVIWSIADIICVLHIARLYYIGIHFFFLHLFIEYEYVILCFASYASKGVNVNLVHRKANVMQWKVVVRWCGFSSGRIFVYFFYLSLLFIYSFFHSNASTLEWFWTYCGLCSTNWWQNEKNMSTNDRLSSILFFPYFFFLCFSDFHHFAVQCRWSLVVIFFFVHGFCDFLLKSNKHHHRLHIKTYWQVV